MAVNDKDGTYYGNLIHTEAAQLPRVIAECRIYPSTNLGVRLWLSDQTGFWERSSLLMRCKRPFRNVHSDCKWQDYLRFHNSYSSVFTVHWKPTKLPRNHDNYFMFLFSCCFTRRISFNVHLLRHILLKRFPRIWGDLDTQKWKAHYQKKKVDISDMPKKSSPEKCTKTQRNV